MKKYILISAAALAAICSCTKTENDSAVKNSVKFLASVEECATKAEIGEIVDGSRDVLWRTGDKITMIGTELSATVGNYSGTDKAKEGEFTFDALTIPASGAWAVYGGTPTKVDANYIYVTRPGTIEMGSAQQAGLMAAYATEGGSLSFRHADGYLGLRIKGTGSVKSIRVTTDDTSFLSGALRINISGTQSAGSVSANEGNRCGSIVLDCGTGVKLSASEAKEFIIPMLPATYSGFLVTITLTDGKVMSKQTKSEKTIKRATVSWMPEITFADNTVLLANCDAFSGYWQSAWQNATADKGNIKEGNCCLYIKHTQGTASGDVMYQTGVGVGNPTVLGTGVDTKATEANGKIIFYIWCDDLISGQTIFELSSSNTNGEEEYKWNNINVVGKLADITAGKWKRVEIPLSDANTKAADLSSIKRIRMYNGNYKNTTSTSLACRIDDIRIVEGDY